MLSEEELKGESLIVSQEKEGERMEMKGKRRRKQKRGNKAEMASKP